MTTAVLFDLGNTLAAYYRRDEFAAILERAIAGARQHLLDAGREVVTLQTALARATEEACRFRRRAHAQLERLDAAARLTGRLI